MKLQKKDKELNFKNQVFTYHFNQITLYFNNSDELFLGFWFSQKMKLEVKVISFKNGIIKVLLNMIFFFISQNRTKVIFFFHIKVFNQILSSLNKINEIDIKSLMKFEKRTFNFFHPNKAKHSCQCACTIKIF